jgi:hypothetical protein
LPSDYPKKLLKYPIPAILVFKFFLGFRFFAKIWIYHILGHLGSIYVAYFFSANVYYLSPSFEKRRFGMSRTERAKNKKLNRVMHINKQLPTTKNLLGTKEPTGVELNQLSQSKPQTAQHTPF